MLAIAPPLGLRPIDAADQPFLDALYRSTRDDLAAMGVPPTLLEQLVRMQQEAEAQGMRSAFPQAEYWLLERGGEAIGRMVVEAVPARVHLIDLALCPAARNMGVGSAVLRALHTLATQRGQPLTLSVAATNPAARRLYLRLGFVGTVANAVQEHMAWPAGPA